MVGLVVGIATGVGISGQIEPVLRATLSVVWRCHQAIHEPFVGVRSRIRNKSGGHVWCGREPGEIETQPPHERGPIGLR